MFIPNIISVFGSDDEGADSTAELPVMLIYAEDENLSATLKEHFENAFVGYNVKDHRRKR